MNTISALIPTDAISFDSDGEDGLDIPKPERIVINLLLRFFLMYVYIYMCMKTIRLLFILIFTVDNVIIFNFKILFSDYNFYRLE